MLTLLLHCGASYYTLPSCKFLQVTELLSYATAEACKQAMPRNLRFRENLKRESDRLRVHTRFTVYIKVRRLNRAHIFRISPPKHSTAAKPQSIRKKFKAAPTPFHFMISISQISLQSARIKAMQNAVQTVISESQLNQFQYLKILNIPNIIRLFASYWKDLMQNSWQISEFRSTDAYKINPVTKAYNTAGKTLPLLWCYSDCYSQPCKRNAKQFRGQSI